MIKPTDLEHARILIVDDCADSAALLEQQLALQNYQDVQVTTDAAVVPDLHELNAYDLILLDMHMPYVSGLNVMAQLRKLAPESFLPVIMLSGNPDMRLSALEAGAYDFITKPYDLTEITARIRNMLEVRLLYRFLDQQGQLQQSTTVHDPLTRLPGRRLALDRVATALEHAKRHRTMAAVLWLDIDDFRLVNDQFGRAHGDELLKILAARLSDRMRREDTVARIGGDEFLIVLRDLSELAGAARAAQEILHLFSTAAAVQHMPPGVTASIGIAVFPLDATGAEQLILRAGGALQQAKRAGKNQYRYADPAEMAAARIGQDALVF